MSIAITLPRSHSFGLATDFSSSPAIVSRSVGAPEGVRNGFALEPVLS
jgi:hypothetical protein